MEKNFGLCCYLDVSALPAQMAGTFQNCQHVWNNENRYSSIIPFVGYNCMQLALLLWSEIMAH